VIGEAKAPPYQSGERSMKRALLAVFAITLTCLIYMDVLVRGQTPVMRPRVEAATPAAATEAELRADFVDPPSEHRSMPLWVWNDQLEWPRLKEQLQQFKQQGMGGVFVHPRPGLMTEYLGDDWFRLWQSSVEEAKRLGLLVNIYDENSYPAGFAGGYVPSRAPDTAAQYVQADFDVDPKRIFQQRGVTVAVFAIEKGAGDQVESARRVHHASEIREGESLVAFQLRRASGNPWTAGFPYVDLTNPRTADAFLETTYEAYKKVLGDELGKTVRWAFTDEPLIATGGAYDNAELALPLSYNTLAEFQRRSGYDLADEIASLYWDVGEFRKVRFDYWQTLHDLWKENFMQPMFEWTDANGLQWTGHWMEHEWPFPWITPDDGSLYAFQHVPGIDMLEGAKLRTDGKDPHLLFTIKQVASVSHQLGRRAFCEAFGVAGWDGTLEHYKRFGDWLMVHGINFIDQHLSFSTVRGARKRDHPQSFTDVSAWWPHYRLHADHLARVSMASSRSEARNRVLVLQQTTSGFLHARRAGDTPELERMRENNAEMNQALADHQVDYDLGNEYMIEWFAKQQGRQIVIGKAAYDLVVWPPDMLTVRSETVPHLEQYLAAGGEILALSPPAAYVDGRPSDRVEQLAARYAAQWRRLGGLSDLVPAIRERVRPRILFERDLPSVGVLERYLANDDRLIFLANTGVQTASSRATIVGGSLEVWDTVTGRIRPARYTARGSTLSFDVELPPAGSLLLVVRSTPGQPDTSPPPAFSPLPAGDWSAQPDALNVLVLDYTDITIGDDSDRDVNTWQANWTAWQRHGFERPAWDNAVQFETRVLDRNPFPNESGFRATFRFHVADAAAIPGMEIALETPELYRVELNGERLDYGEARRWLDPHIPSLNVEKVARVGENVVAITAQPFDVRMELENIYVRGNFTVEPAAKGFRINAPDTLGLGSWAKQGYPFYGSSVTYETEVTVPEGSDQLRVEIPEWQGSVAVVLVDGKQAATVAWQPFRAVVPVSAGRHTVAVKIVSTPRNTFGPFHNPAKPRMRAWPAAWADFPDHQPAGSDYDVLDYGLMAKPTISAGEGSKDPSLRNK
jgi:hypothetical protein